MKKLRCSGYGTFECNLHLDPDKFCIHQEEHYEQEDCFCASQIIPCVNYKCMSISDIRKEKLKKIENE